MAVSYTFCICERVCVWFLVEMFVSTADWHSMVKSPKFDCMECVTTMNTDKDCPYGLHNELLTYNSNLD